MTKVGQGNGVLRRRLGALMTVWCMDEGVYAGFNTLKPLFTFVSSQNAGGLVFE